MLTDADVATLNNQACTNNLGRQGEWDELNEDGKAWARELARLAYEKGLAERPSLRGLRWLLVMLALVGLAAVGYLTVARSRAHRDFVDACKQEQPIERCEAMWRAGGVR